MTPAFGAFVQVVEVIYPYQNRRAEFENSTNFCESRQDVMHFYHMHLLVAFSFTL
jgi:hypothetical protein